MGGRVMARIDASHKEVTPRDVRTVFFPVYAWIYSRGSLRAGGKRGRSDLQRGADTRHGSAGL